MTQCLFPFVSGWLSKKDAVEAAATKKPGDANAVEKEEEEEEDQEDDTTQEEGEFEDAYGCFALQQRSRRVHGPKCAASRSCQQGVR